MNLLNKKVLIVGFGKSGQAALRFCLKQGARPAVTDAQKKESFGSVLDAFKGYPVDWYLGSHDPDLFLSADLIVVSPGVPWNLKSLKAAREK
ncbi:MAG: UDP-N-acetylmuramoyl-L-alanine--D-glutamate ligase, partial [bacterium]|nr:UDP-N-acetylmuramoyl-L-alanine--D-glutamate ligase [bacterium]